MKELRKTNKTESRVQGNKLVVHRPDQRDPMGEIPVG